MMRAWLIWVPMVVLTGCAAQDRQSLQEAVYEYTHGMRWSRHEYVTRYLAAKSRHDYVVQRERLGDLKITTCRVASVRVRSADRATVVLTVDWFQLSRGRLHSTLVEQDWARKGKGWRVVRQAWLRGAPLPIFPNPA